MFFFSTDICAVQAICLVVAGVEKVNALNFVFVQRYKNVSVVIFLFIEY